MKKAVADPEFVCVCVCVCVGGGGGRGGGRVVGRGLDPPP